MKPRLDPFGSRDVRVLAPGDVTNLFSVREKAYRKSHYVYEGAPCEWSRMRGATHTLWIGSDDIGGGGTRPAHLLKTSIWVGVDEIDNDIRWQRWEILPGENYGGVIYPKPKQYNSMLSMSNFAEYAFCYAEPK